MGSFVRHEPCPACGSSDALARYDNGSATCFKCQHYEPETGKAVSSIHEAAPREWTPVHGDIVAIPNRGLSEETCKFWGYEKGTYKDKTCHIANFKDHTGRLTHQKIRLPGKKFLTLGGQNLPFYGQWLWSRGKHLVITEGEIDALSMSQAFDNKWPVVSLPNGVNSVEKAIASQYDWLDNFERIVLMFDTDEPGQEAAKLAAAMLPPGKAAIAVLPEKDANEVLKEHGKAALLRAFWDAPQWKPDGIVDGGEFTVADLKAAASVGYQLPYPKLQERTLGLRKAEITMLTSGSGMGKSTLARELAYFLNQTYGLAIGNVFLEEGSTKTAQGYVAMHNNVPLGQLRNNPDMLNEEQWQDGLKVVHNRMWFFKHFGSLESENLLARMRYLASVCKVDFIILDHISIVVSGNEASTQGERKDIDVLMTRLRSLAEATGVGIIAVVHLKRVKDKSFNDGAQVSLSDLRGSGSLELLSDSLGHRA